MDDPISRQAAIDALRMDIDIIPFAKAREYARAVLETVYNRLEELPSAQPDYQEVLGWLLAYHTMSFDLHGRYLPHEVISWLINDFTKEFIAERRTE